ncbi:AraC family transcriptional regulator [soil metagenome]
MDRLISSIDWPLAQLPTIRTAGRFPLEDRQFGALYLSDTHALHIHNYDGALQLGDRTIALRPGDVTISPAGVPSRYELPRPGFHWCVHLRPARREIGPAALLPLHFPLGSLGDHAGQKVMAIAQLRAGGDPVSLAAASAAMLELLLWLSMQSRLHRRAGGASRGAEAVDRVATIMHARLAGDLCVADLAGEVQMTQNYLARLFRQRYGSTMPHFLLTCRIDHAKHLLRHTAIPIGRVAVRSGMPDPQHFNKQFRRLVGVSPSEFRSRR